MMNDNIGKLLDDAGIPQDSSLEDRVRQLYTQLLQSRLEANVLEAALMDAQTMMVMRPVKFGVN